MTVKEMKEVLERLDDNYEIEVNVGGEYVFSFTEDQVKWDDQYQVVEIVYDLYWKDYMEFTKEQLQIIESALEDTRDNTGDEEWAEEKIRQNKISFLKDSIQKINEFRNQKAPEFYNQVGVNYPELEKEKWDVDMTQVNAMADEALEEYTKVLNELEKQ